MENHFKREVKRECGKRKEGRERRKIIHPFHPFLLVVMILLGGYSSPISISSDVAKKRIPPAKKVLLKYHLEKFLSSELGFTPLLSAENHPHGWQKPDCLQCHTTPSWQPSTVCVNCHGRNGVLTSGEGPGGGSQENTCNSCHKAMSYEVTSSEGQNEFGYPSTGNHASHVLKGPKDKDCLQCHPGNDSIAHANGYVDIFFIKGGEYRMVSDLSTVPDTGSLRSKLLSERSESRFVGTNAKPQAGSESSGMALQPNPPNPSLIKGSKGFCSGIACHEDRYWGGEGCEACHGDPPNTGSHVVHFENHPESTCRDCHKDNEHDEDKNSGSIEIGGVEYNNITGYCETKCHDTVKSDLSAVPDTAQAGKPLTWDCASCHGYPPQNGNHDPNIHKESCEQCHKNHRHSYKAATRPWDFSDTEVAFARGGRYNPLAPFSKGDKIDPDDKMAGSPPPASLPTPGPSKEGRGMCSGLSGCHESRIWGSHCTDCHGKPPNTSTHVLHLEQKDITCQSCHKNNIHKSFSFQLGYQTEGLIELGGVQYDATTGKCVSTCHKPLKWDCVTCHGYPPANGAHLSHNAPSEKMMGWPPVKDVKSFSSRLYQSIFDVKQPGVPCLQCHTDHQHLYKAAVAPMDFTSIQVSFSQGGNFNRSDGLCSNIACHEPLKWNSKCNDCHGNPPQTGLHTVHLQQKDVNCDNCHKGREHDLDDKSGTIDIGGITYDKFTGGCTSSCHETTPLPPFGKGEHEIPPTPLLKRGDLWDCTSCHSKTPDTGQHVIHTGKLKLGCHTCHADHEHSYKAATTPNEYDDVTVKFSIRGNWDKSTEVCSNIGCHGDNKWSAENGIRNSE